MTDEKPKITARIDSYVMPHIDFPDPKVLGLLAEINFAFKQLRSGSGPGPYGTIEDIMRAIDEFIEEWNG